MTHKDVRTTLHQLKNEARGGAPRDGWVKGNREVLMMQIRNTVDPQSTRSMGDILRHFFAIFIPAESIRMVGSAVGVFLLVAMSVIGGGITSAQAYRDAAPGGLLYSMKLAVERAQLAVAPNDAYRARLHAEFADRRIEELTTLAEQPVGSQAAAATVIASLGDELHAEAVGLERLRAENPAEVIRVAKLIERKMDLYRGQLAKAGETLPSELHAEVAALHDLTDEVTIKAMAIIVEKHLAGDLEASRSVVDTKFEERIKQAESDLDAAVDANTTDTSASSATKAKAAIAAARQFLQKEDYEAALSKIVEVAQLTKEVQNADEPTTTPTTSTTGQPKTETASDGSTNTDATVPTKTEATASTTDTTTTSGSTGSPEHSGDAAGSGSR